MSFDYDVSMKDPVSRLRFLIADTEECGRYFEDEELRFLLEENANNLYKAASEACFNLYTQFSQSLTVIEIDNVRLETKDRIKYYKDLYEKFADKAASENGKYPLILVGGAERRQFIKDSQGRETTPNRDVDVFFDLNRRL